MNIKNIVALEEVKKDIKTAQDFYEKQSFGFKTKSYKYYTKNRE